MERYPMFTNRLNTVKMSVLPNSSIFNTISIKNLSMLPCRYLLIDSKAYVRQKDPE